MTDHRLTEHDLAGRTAYCRGCAERVPIVSAGDSKRKGINRWKCAIAARALARAMRENGAVNEKHFAWREANRDLLRARNLAKNYNMSIEQYDALATAQGGRCAICRREPSGGPRDKVLHVDHRHSDGVIRGLLCHDCNKGIGCLKDDLELLRAAIAYLERTAQLGQGDSHEGPPSVD